MAQRLHKSKSMKLGLRHEEQMDALRPINGTEPFACAGPTSAATDSSLVALARALRFASAEAAMAQRMAHQRGA